ncbi:MAG: zinc ribbon domain-containing protein [Thermodesulfobacteriota bacterium]|nr:zinc ribbon domain-containing protein [Thermodesulfobacteriota bacterium]
MPIYEYKCSNCEKEFEAMQKISDPPLTNCKFCSGEVTKLISQCTFHLKGTGWYATDYAGKSGGADQKPKETEVPTSTTTSDDSKDTSSTESTDP